MNIVFMGTPEFAVPSLAHLIYSRYKVAAVYTTPDRPSGRGRALSFSPVKMAALGWELPVMQPASFKEAGAVERLASFHPDVIVVCAFGRILPLEVLDIPRHGCINIHPSLLPRFRGASPVAAAILAGDEFTGVSIMLMDAGLDTGPVLGRAQVSISAQDTTGSLTAKLAQTAAWLLQEVLAGWLRGEITPRRQNEAEATLSRPLAKEEGEIDWSLSATEIWRRVRAFQPWPGCYTRWQGKQLEIIGAVPLPEEGNYGAGQVVALSPNSKRTAAFGIGTGNGLLGVSKLQLEGRRAISADEFLRGQRDFIEAVLPSS